MTLENILTVLGTLVGWPLFVALVIDVLKYFGVVTDGTAGKWNLGLNLVAFVLVGVATGFFPDFNIPAFDAVLLEYVKIAGYIFAVLVQILGTRVAHKAYLKTDVGRKYFTYNGYRSIIGY